MHKIRKSPSGPVIFEVGAGFTTRRTKSTFVNDAEIILNQDAKTFLGPGTGTPTAEVVSLSAPGVDRNYYAEASVVFESEDVTQTADLSLILEYSTNGTNWQTFSQSDHSVGANPGGTPPQQPGLFQLTWSGEKTGAEIFPSGIGSVTELQFRAAVQWAGSPPTLIYRSDGPNGTGYVMASEELAG